MRTNLLLRCANKNPNEIAIEADDYKITYLEYYQLSKSISKRINLFLERKNIKEKNQKLIQTKISVLSQNSVEYLILIQAMILSKWLLIHFNFRFSQTQIIEQLKATNCNCLFISNNKNNNFSNKLFLKNKINTFSLEEFIPIKSLLTKIRRKSLFKNNISKELFLKKNIFLNYKLASNVIFTSGSTVSPKAVIHSYANHYYSALGSYKVIPFMKKDKWLLSIGLFHIGGLAIIFRSLLKSGTVVISQNSIEENIKKFKLTHLSLVATQLYRLLEHPQNISFLKKMKYILLGGSAIPNHLIQQALYHDLPVYISYGSSELSSQVCTSAVSQKMISLKNLPAKILPFRKIKISQNEILLKGATLFLGYLSQNKIHSPLDSGGWFHSRDTGYLIEDNLFVTGRIDNMFISGGENIQPEEIEKAILTIEEVQNVLVIPVNNKEYGKRPIALIQLKKSLFDKFNINNSSKMNRIKEKILYQLKQTLSNFQIPDDIIFVEQLIENNSLKINRNKWISKFQIEYQ